MPPTAQKRLMKARRIERRILELLIVAEKARRKEWQKLLLSRIGKMRTIQEAC